QSGAWSAPVGEFEAHKVDRAHLLDGAEAVLIGRCFGWCRDRHAVTPQDPARRRRTSFDSSKASPGISAASRQSTHWLTLNDAVPSMRWNRPISVAAMVAMSASRHI